MRRLLAGTLALTLATVGCTGPNCLGWGDAQPIHRAAYKGNLAKLGGELDRGVSPDTPAHVPEYDFKAGGVWQPETSPLRLAIQGGQCEAISLLLARGVSVPNDLLHSIIVECPQCLGGALQQGVPPNELNEQGFGVTWGRPLHVAATYDNLQAAAQLVEAGADVNGRDTFGGTPLHDAANWGALEMAGWLLQHGADPLARDRRGATPLHAAREIQPGPARDAMFRLLERAITDSGRDVPEIPPLIRWVP